MKKIEFKNGQQPALSEEILNKMQDNIEEAIETVNVIKVYQTSPQIANQNQKVNLQTYKRTGTLLTYYNSRR